MSDEYAFSKRLGTVLTTVAVCAIAESFTGMNFSGGQQAKLNELKQAGTPITAQVITKTPMPNGDTLTTARTDTVAYQIPASRFKPKQ